MDKRLMEKLLPKKNTEKASWASRNEGIHERVNFDDTIWGFDLAGGIYYGTPLRVTAVYPDSRADKAGIRPGDKLNRINDIDTSTLTIQEAHDMILESGVYIRLAVSAPEDTEDSYGCFQDSFDDGYDSEEERRKEEAARKKRIIVCKTNSRWSLMWPWSTKKAVIYKESNCFMVPSIYEVKHKDRLLPLTVPDSMITLQPKDAVDETIKEELKPVEQIKDTVAETIKEEAKPVEQPKYTVAETIKEEPEPAEQPKHIAAEPIKEETEPVKQPNNTLAKTIEEKPETIEEESETIEEKTETIEEEAETIEEETETIEEEAETIEEEADTIEEEAETVDHTDDTVAETIEEEAETDEQPNDTESETIEEDTETVEQPNDTVSETIEEETESVE